MLDLNSLASGGPATAKPTSLSVLICTYNRAEMLRRALTALIERTEEKPDQIVIVNGGDERADEVVKSMGKSAKGEEQRSKIRGQTSENGSQRAIEIKLIKTLNKNLAASRNVGLPHCKGAIVAMTDDDAEVYPDWITQMKRVHAEHPEAGAVGGAVIGAQSGEDFLSRLADMVTFVSPSEPQSVRTLPGVNVSYKRHVVEQVGLQDETLFRGEDVDFNWRVKELGYKVYYHPAIKIIHHHRPTFRQFLRQHYMYGRAYYLVRRKWPEMYCVYPPDSTYAYDALQAERNIQYH